jgi:transposase InsO family protein
VPEIEAAILTYALEHPTYGAQRVANELRLKGLTVSSGGVRGVWSRNAIETRLKRLLRLEQHAQEQMFVVSEEQLALLERHSVDFRCRHIEASRPGELLNQDTFYWGTLKGVGKVYVQVAIDVFCSFAFAKVYTSKMPVTACDLLYERVMPFYDELAVTLGAVLTDNGREFCGRTDSHPYELLLAMDGIEHRNTKIRSPRTNGFVERMNRTLLDECFRVAGRTTWYTEVAEIQRDLDRFLVFYNLERSHQGYRLKGRTPAQAMREALGVEDLPPYPTSNSEPQDEASREEVSTPAA